MLSCVLFLPSHYSGLQLAVFMLATVVTAHVITGLTAQWSLLVYLIFPFVLLLVILSSHKL